MNWLNHRDDLMENLNRRPQVVPIKKENFPVKKNPQSNPVIEGTLSRYQITYHIICSYHLQYVMMVNWHMIVKLVTCWWLKVETIVLLFFYIVSWNWMMRKFTGNPYI